MFRTMSVHEFRDICADPVNWYRRYLRPIGRSVDVQKTAGNIVHLALSDAPGKKEAIQGLYRQIESKLGARKQTEELVVRLLRASRHYFTPEEHTAEEQFFHTDPDTGWSLCATTDLNWIDDGGWLHIAEHKSGRAPMFNHLTQLQYYALVVALARRYNGPIKCHLRLLGTGDEVTYIILRERMDAFHQLVKRALKHFDALLTSAVDYTTMVRPKLKPYLERAMAESELKDNLHAWWEVSKKAGTNWERIHARKVRSWKELRMCPVRLAHSVAYRSRQPEWAPLSVPSAFANLITPGEFVPALRCVS